jgi:hypothetical protein
MAALHKGRVHLRAIVERQRAIGIYSVDHTCLYCVYSKKTQIQVQLRIALNAQHSVVTLPKVRLSLFGVHQLLHGTSGLQTRGSPQCVNIAGLHIPCMPTSRLSSRLSSPRMNSGKLRREPARSTLCDTINQCQHSPTIS